MQFRTILAASAAVIIGAAAAQAAEVAALSGDNTISIVNTSSKSVTKTWKIQGVTGKVLGIDVRPADGMVYVITSDGTIGTIDLKTGLITKKSKLSQPWKAGTTTIDFNPVADRLRVMSSEGVNARVNVDDGQVTVDGVVINEPYVNDLTNPYQPNTWTLGPNQYFVLGDNRGDSSDSRDWGPVPRDDVIGRAELVYWPLSKVHVLSDWSQVYSAISR